jgi:hypothetical protein
MTARLVYSKSDFWGRIAETILTSSSTQILIPSSTGKQVFHNRQMFSNGKKKLHQQNTISSGQEERHVPN